MTLLKKVWLFVLTSLITGFVTVAGSILGNAFGKTGLFAGAIAGGVCVWFLPRGLLSAFGLSISVDLRSQHLEESSDLAWQP